MCIQYIQKFSVSCLHGRTIQSPEIPSDLNSSQVGFRVFSFKDIAHYSIGSGAIVIPGGVSKDLSSWIISKSFAPLGTIAKCMRTPFYQYPVKADEKTLQRPCIQRNKKGCHCLGAIRYEKCKSPCLSSG